MLDRYVRPVIDIPLNYVAKNLNTKIITANKVTITGFAFGIIAMLLISWQYYLSGLLFIFINRTFDGIDGAIARLNGATDFGGALDIVCDFVFCGGIVFAFGIANPEYNFYTSFLIFSFIGPISSFLAYAIIAAKKNINTSLRGKKSFYHLGGICEGTETIFTLSLLCLFPNKIDVICIIYGTLCWITTIGRMYNIKVDFK